MSLVYQNIFSNLEFFITLGVAIRFPKYVHYCTYRYYYHNITISPYCLHFLYIVIFLTNYCSYRHCNIIVKSYLIRSCRFIASGLKENRNIAVYIKQKQKQALILNWLIFLKKVFVQIFNSDIVSDVKHWVFRNFR